MLTETMPQAVKAMDRANPSLAAGPLEDGRSVIAAMGDLVEFAAGDSLRPAQVNIEVVAEVHQVHRAATRRTAADLTEHGLT